MNALAFDNPWEVVGLVALVVLIRLVVANLTMLRDQRAAVLEFVDSALIAVLLVFCILRPFVVQAFYIPSGSMLDTLQINDRILVNKFVYFFEEPKDGDVVVFDAPEQALMGDNQKKDFIKRVVGVPGDRISVHDHRLFRNGVPIDEPYVKGIIDYQWPDSTVQGMILRPGEKPAPVLSNGEIIVPAGYLLVMGDNRNDSNDSHRWSSPDADGTWQSAPFLPRENVLGKAFCIFFPPGRMRLIRSISQPALPPQTAGSPFNG